MWYAFNKPIPARFLQGRSMNEEENATLHDFLCECVGCSLGGWRESLNMIHPITDEPITVSRGYGKFEGSVLVTAGYVTDEEFRMPRKRQFYFETSRNNWVSPKEM